VTDEAADDNHLPDNYRDRLIQAHFDGGLDDAGRREFAEMMRDSEAARRRFWALAEVHALARDAALAAWPGEALLGDNGGAASLVVPQPVAIPHVSRVPAGLRPLGLIAAGLALGVFMTGLAWAMTRTEPAPPEVLLAEGFESSAAPIAAGVPTAADVWSGDLAELVEAQAGVEPAGGRRMLRFVSADYSGKPNPGGYIGEIYRLIDVRRYRRTTSGDAVVQVSALFNAAAAAAADKFHYSLSLYALDEATAAEGSTPGAAVLAERALATSRRSNDVLDADAGSWQKMSVELRLPPNAEYLLVRLAVGHAGPSRTTVGHETFVAHYADDVRVVLAERPELP
jgi:hypothetical protein